MKSRDYQEEHITKIIEEVSIKRKIVAQLPTGGGKTVEFVKIAQRYTRNTGKSVLILVNREELLYQAEKTVKSIMNMNPHLITSTTKRHAETRVYIGMVGSTISRLSILSNVGLVIIDECHIAEFNKIHSIFLEELIIGFTATPLSSSKKEPLNKYYKSIVCGPSIKNLIENNFLSQNITRCPKDIVDYTQFQIDSLKGDYNERQMAAEYKLPKHVTNVVKAYTRFCNKEKTLIFNVNIEHSLEVTKCLAFCGHNVKHLDSNSPDRKEILEWFKNTENAILCNVMITTFGFDEPTVKNVILNFSTLSLPKFIQTCGRGSRFIDSEWIEKNWNGYPYNVQEKKTFNIIDMGGNCIRFGDWNDERDWEYIFNNPSIPKGGVAPIKTCPCCEGLVHAASRICTLTNENGELCLHEFEKKKSMVEQDLEEMILITKGIDVDALITKNKKKYEYYTFLELGYDVVKRMMDRSENNPSSQMIVKYFKVYYNLCIEWYNRTIGKKEEAIEDISNSGFHIRMAQNNFNSIIKNINKEAEIYDKNIIYEWNKIESF